MHKLSELKCKMLVIVYNRWYNMRVLIMIGGRELW